MLHPSYTDLINAVNSEVEAEEAKAIEAAADGDPEAFGIEAEQVEE